MRPKEEAAASAASASARRSIKAPRRRRPASNSRERLSISRSSSERTAPPPTPWSPPPSTSGSSRPCWSRPPSPGPCPSTPPRTSSSPCWTVRTIYCYSTLLQYSDLLDLLATCCALILSSIPPSHRGGSRGPTRGHRAQTQEESGRPLQLQRWAQGRGRKIGHHSLTTQGVGN